MPTVNIQIANVKRIKNNISFQAVTDNKVIERTIDISTVDNWNDFANWLINQDHDFELVPDKEKSLTITFHNETLVDPEFGTETILRVVDDVGVS